MPLLSLALAWLPQAQEPVALLPDPVAFVEDLLVKLDAEAQPIWTRQFQIWSPADEPGASLQSWSWQDPVIAAGWSRISTLLREHADPDLARWHSTADFKDYSRNSLMLLLAKLPIPTQRELSVAAESTTPAGRVVAIQIVDRAVQEDLHQDRADWVWLREREGRWTLSGIAPMNPQEGLQLPSCARARPWQLTDDFPFTLALRWVPSGAVGGERRLLATGSPAVFRDLAPEGPFGIERVAREFDKLCSKATERAPSDAPLQLHVKAPADTPLEALWPVRRAAAVPPDRALQLLLRVELDDSRRPGVLVFEQSEGAALNTPTLVEAGAPPSAWPETLRAGTPPAVVGIALRKDATVQDLAKTADALLARGVSFLFLAPPLWDPSRGGDPDERARVERHLRLSEEMKGGESKEDGDR